MKHCYKMALLCGLLALGAFFLLSKAGLPGSAAFVAPIMMAACCILPVLFMATKGGAKSPAEGCCSAKKDPAESRSCH